jgi:hypothetical protein
MKELIKKLKPVSEKYMELMMKTDKSES